MASVIRVAVVGAGMGGLATASALLNTGVRVEVYDQFHQFERVGAGIHVGPNAMKVLHSLGLSVAEAKARAFIPEVSCHRDFDTGHLSSKLDLGESAVERFGAHYMLWHRGDLQDALRRMVPSAIINLDRQLTAVSQRDGEVTLRFADGSTSTADVVIAADGIHSLVRRTVFGAADPHFTHRVAYRGVIPREEVKASELDPHCKWWGDDRHFVHYHVSGGRELAFTTSIPEDDWPEESWSQKGDIQNMRSALADFHPDVQAILDAVAGHPLNRWAIHTREPLEHWVDGHIALLGDACHTMPPYLGQGAAMAIEDGVILARCLEAIDNDHTRIGQALQRYERTRMERVSTIQALAQANVGRYGRDAEFLYRYNAWTAELAPETDS